MKKNERLLHEYVKVVLIEDDGYADLALDAAGMSPYGVHFGSYEDLYKVFLKPFVDVIDTAAGKTKELSRKAITLGKTAFEAIATSIVPWVSDNYDEIFAEDKKKIDEIKKEYGDVYKANWDAFKDNDMLFAAFAYSPTAFLTIAFMKKSPKAATRLVSVLSGGALDGWIQKVSKKYGWDEKVTTGLDFTGTGPSSGPYYEGHLREEKNVAKTPAEIFSNKKVIAKLQDSDVVKSLSSETRSSVRGTLKKLFSQAQSVMRAKSIADVEKVTGKKIKGTEKLNSLQGEERSKIEAALLAAVKKGFRDVYVRNLEAFISSAEKRGVPGDSEYLNDFRSIVSKIKSL